MGFKTFSGDKVDMKPITGIAGCCARAANGHAAAPPSSVMKSRRFKSGIGFPPRLAADGQFTAG
jgi:hypothetical protein